MLLFSFKKVFISFLCFLKKYNKLLFFQKVFFLWYIIMQCLSLKEDNIIKDIRNIFKVKKKQNYGTVKDLKDLFRQEK